MRKILPPGKKDSSGAYIKETPAPDLGPFKLSDFLFDKQLKFVEDPRPFKVAVCSRRAGKTVACAAHLIDIAMNNKEVVCLYITLSRNNAKKLIWKEIEKINRLYKLGGTPDHTELSMTFPTTGSVIYLSGAKDQSEIEKFRGLALKIVYIDECQSFKEYIEDLVDDILSPALMDYAGTLCLIGTPGAVPAGYFHKCAVDTDAWSHHGWTFFDNPFVEVKSGKTHQELLDRELKRRGVKMEDPSIQREYFGRWELDSDSLWIHYDPAKNHFIEQIPRIKYNYIMGIDLGYEDADAIAVIGWSEQDPCTYLVEEIVMKRQGITELVEQIQYLAKKYDVGKMVIDEGGLGKKLAEEMRRRHGVPVQPADKARKMENVAFLNDSLRTGRFKAKSASHFAQDSYLVEIDRNKSTPEKIKLSDKYHSDIIDAVLYAFKESPAFTYQKPVELPKPGTKEWADAQQAGMWSSALDHFQEQAELERKISEYGE
jgi:phage terminase large subunit-like protein